MNKVFTRVDLPSPDSPVEKTLLVAAKHLSWERLTDDHHGKLEALADTFPVDLVGQVGKPDISVMRKKNRHVSRYSF